MADYALNNDIYIGSVDDPLYHYSNDRIVLGSAKGIFSLDVIGNELPIDTFSVIVRYNPNEYEFVYAVRTDDSPDWDGSYELYYTAERIYPPVQSHALYLVVRSPADLEGLTGVADYLTDVPYGTPVYWFTNNAYYAKGYLKSVERVGKYAWKLTAVSGVGLLDTKMHAGGLYTGETAQTLLTSIIGTTFPFSIHNSVKEVQVFGHLPYDTARNNLHQLLFAVGCAMRKYVQSTDYFFNFLSSGIIDIPKSRISINGSVTTQLPANKVEVAEHGFFSTAGDEVATLFDNTGGVLAAADHQLVIFDKSPVYGLATTGSLTINESNCNYAIVTGTGVLTGKLYTHTIQIIEQEDNPTNAPARVKRVETNELVSAVNSRNVARRVLNFYKSTKTVKGELVLENEKAGDYVQATDAFGDMTQGYIAKVEITPTSIKGANVEIIDGYISEANGNNYTKRELLTISGSWVAQRDGPIRIILIQGGTGGQGGYDGKAGLAGTRYIPGGQDMPMDVAYVGLDWAQEDPREFPDRKLYYVSSQPPSDGGAAGAGGAQGKVYVVDVEVHAGDVVRFSVGKGGVGGDKNGGAGTAGTHTTATVNGTTYTSADGHVNGYYDPLAKTTYGIKGKNGYKGGHGGTAGTGGAPKWNWTGHDGGDGMNGGSVAGFLGGAGGAGTGYDGASYPAQTSHGTNSHMSGYKFFSCGSGGGGAAYGNSGQPGGTYNITEWWVDNPDLGQLFYGFDIENAAGGAGADAIAPLKASIGNGGQGGNGGGGGGNASGVYCTHAYWIYHGLYDYAMYPGGSPHNAAGQTGAPGGSGSAGGDGGDGGVIIYS